MKLTCVHAYVCRYISVHCCESGVFRVLPVLCCCCVRTYVCTYICTVSDCSAPQMRVTGNNLQNACKLIFTISKDESNDPFFASEQLIGKVPISLHCTYVFTHVFICTLYFLHLCMYIHSYTYRCLFISMYVRTYVSI